MVRFQGQERQLASRYLFEVVKQAMKKEKSQFGCPRLALFGYSMHILFVESLYHDFIFLSKYQ